MDTELEEKSKFTSLYKQTISRFLKYLMETILHDDRFKELHHLDTGTMADVMDLNIISQKIDCELYDSLEGFLVNILCIKHHYVTHDQSSPRLGTVRELMKYCESELKNIISCAECYENKHTKSGWRSLPCSKPHLVLWVKVDDKIATPDSLPKEDIPYWPAKLLSVDDNAANVIFFGYSEFVEIPTENCFLYSTEAPPSLKQTHKSKDFEDALEEVDLYKQIIRPKFGRFEDQLKSIPLNPNRLDEHMRDIFPDYSYALLNEYREIKVETDDTDENESYSLRNFEPLECESIINNCFPQTIKCEPESNNYVFEAGNEEKSSCSDDDEMPNKRQRLSEEAGCDVDKASDKVSNPISSSSSGSFNAHESNTNRSYKPQEYESSTNIQSELCQAIDRMQNITNIATNLEKENMLTIQALRKELEDLKKSYDDSQLKNVELLDRLNVVTGERDLAKNEVTRLKKEHAKGMMALTELHNEEAAMARTKLEKVRQDAHDLLVKTQKQHKMKLNLKTSIENEQDERESLHKRLQSAIDQKQRFYELNNRLKNEISSLKKEIKNMEHDKSYQLRNHNNSMRNLKTNHINELNEIQDQHKIELETERKRASDTLETLKTEYSQEVTALETQFENVIEEKAKNEAQLEQKYQQIVNNIKTKAKKCTGCDESKSVLFCSSLCENVWTSLNKSSTTKTENSQQSIKI